MFYSSLRSTYIQDLMSWRVQLVEFTERSQIDVETGTPSFPPLFGG
jgi:hypothetical protein